MSEKPYKSLEKIFHKIVLGSKTIQKVSFSFEQSFFDSQYKPNHEAKSVFVCGLARSGTTILLKLLYGSEQFETLTYRDMPFCLAPRLWRKISGLFQKPSVEMERAHADDIFIDFDSPESFEEIFWSAFSSLRRDKSGLYHLAVEDDTVDNFKKFRVTIGYKSNIERRYLSKNNNNLIRLNLLKSLCKKEKSNILIPFRNPIQTASSLLKQHLSFSEMQKEDAFIADYMGWLGHYEFGLNAVPLAWDDHAFACLFEKDDINYWIAYWIHIHQYILKNLSDEITLVCYEDLCEAPDAIVASLLSKLDVKQVSSNLAEMIKKSPYHQISVPIDQSLHSLSHDIYHQLQNKSL